MPTKTGKNGKFLPALLATVLIVASGTAIADVPDAVFSPKLMA